MSELPSGWVWTTFDELSSNIQYGYTASANDNPVGPKFLRITDIQNGKVNWDTVPYCKCSDDDLKKYRLESGDIVFARTGATTGKSFLITNPPKAVFASYLIRLILQDKINRKYFSYFFDAPNYWAQIMQVRKGSAQPGVNAAILAQLQVPLAPLPEQKRIADKLDTLLARVDSCQSHLERVPQILKRFRQSVLAAATSGRLTEEWRNENGRGLLDWIQVPAEDLIENIEAGINVKCDERPPLEHERGLVKISAVTWGQYNDNESKTLPKNHEIPDRTRIKVGDFLISRANTIELVGACVIVDQVNRPVFLSDKVLRLVMNDDVKRWMLYWLRSDAGRKQIESLASGNQLSMRNISQANLRNIQVNLPKPDERDEIVRRVERLFAFAERLEVRWRAGQELVEQLTPSLLAKAFRGELVEQDAEDEPAAVLLERIKAERSVLKKLQNGIS